MILIDSKLSKDWINIWLNTPQGSIYGYPFWGENFRDLIGENMNNVAMKLDLIMDKMRYDLGDQIAQFVTNISLISVDNEKNYIVIYILNEYTIFVEVGNGE